MTGSTVRLIFYGILIMISFGDAFATDWDAFNPQSCNVFLSGLLKKTIPNETPLLQEYFEALAKELPDSNLTAKDIQTAFVDMINHGYHQKSFGDKSRIQRMLDGVFVPKMQQEASRLKNPVQKFSDLASLDRRTQFSIIDDELYRDDRIGKLLIAELQKRGFDLPLHQLQRTALKTLDAAMAKINIRYAELVSHSFTLDQWASAVQPSLNVKEIADTRWKLTKVVPVFDGFLEQITDANLTGVLNTDKSMPEIFFRTVESTDGSIKLSVELQKWGRKDKTLIRDGHFNAASPSEGPAHISFDTPTFEKGTGGGFIPFGNGMVKPKERGLLLTDGNAIGIKCALKPDGNLICIGFLNAHYDFGQDYVKAFHKKGVFLIELKKTGP